METPNRGAVEPKQMHPARRKDARFLNLDINHLLREVASPMTLIVERSSSERLPLLPLA